MNKEKQIEELGEEIYQHCYADLFKFEANDIAGFVINEQGYRKANEVAEDIIRMLRAAGINEWRYPIIAEIKKKYAEDK